MSNLHKDRKADTYTLNESDTLYFSVESVCNVAAYTAVVLNGGKLDNSKIIYSDYMMYIKSAGL